MDQAIRDNKDKIDFTILPWEIVGEVVKVFEFGASKYTRDNYQKGDGLPLANYHQSAMRHLVASMTGEENDKECSEFHKMPVDHMAHVAANALMYLWQKQHEGRKLLMEENAKQPDMVDVRCISCDYPFIKPSAEYIQCPMCGELNDLKLAATNAKPCGSHKL